MFSSGHNLAKDILIPQKVLPQRFLRSNRRSQVASKNPHQSHGGGNEVVGEAEDPLGKSLSLFNNKHIIHSSVKQLPSICAC